MYSVQLDDAVLANVANKTAIITGAAGGIGAQIVTTFAANGANVVVADLEYARKTGEELVASLPDPSKGLFVAVNILDWAQMKSLFKQSIAHFGSIEYVIANAGVMESKSGMDVESVDADGELLEATEVSKVIDINLKGTLSTIRLGMHHMKDNKPCFPDGSKGSILLVISTSGYFGATGVVGYIASKHGVTGLLRASQVHAKKYGLRVNGVAPFFTPTNMAKNFAAEWAKRKLPENTPEGVAKVIMNLSSDHNKRGSVYLACGPILREMELTRRDLIPDWLGQDTATLMGGAGKLFEDIGGYPYPSLAAMKVIMKE